MFARTLFCLFFGLSYLSASCVSNIEINFDFKKSTIQVNSHIQSKNENLEINFDGFVSSTESKVKTELMRDSGQKII
ncbi:MAG: hypothetical protein HRT43_01430, partial [Campylobacteraceae bacterium]|nr:hypothetical protein [Campylobacteraceae bacterium]